MSKEVMQQALDALEDMKAEFRALDLPYGSNAYVKANSVSHTLREALAQPGIDWQQIAEQLMEQNEVLDRKLADLVQLVRRVEAAHGIKEQS